MDLFKRFVPDISEIATRICEALGTSEYLDVLKTEYEKMPVINFDNALLEQLNKESAYVICEDIGWSDIGAWEALKEALEQKREDNVTNGRVMLEESVDNLVYNYENDKLIVGIDLDNLLVVNTGDVLLVARKTSVGKIKTLVENFQGTENENLT
jgi:mannose-1-phosphate guanylyltransferase